MAQTEYKDLPLAGKVAVWGVALIIVFCAFILGLVVVHLLVSLFDPQ